MSNTVIHHISPTKNVHVLSNQTKLAHNLHIHNNIEKQKVIIHNSNTAHIDITKSTKVVIVPPKPQVEHVKSHTKANVHVSVIIK